MEQASIKTQDRTLAILVHLIGLFTSWLGPLIIYLIKKDDDPLTADNAREALNFQLTVMFAYIICAVLAMLLIGLFLMWIVALLNLIFCIVAAVKTSNNVAYRYPMTLRLIK